MKVQNKAFALNTDLIAEYRGSLWNHDIFLLFVRLIVRFIKTRNGR